MKQKKAEIIDLRDYFTDRQRDVEEKRAAGELRLDSLRRRAEPHRPHAAPATRREGGNAA